MGWGSFRDKYITGPAEKVADVATFGHGEELGDYLTLDLQKETVDKIGSSLTDIGHDLSGKTGAEAAEEAARLEAEGQMDELAYLKEINRLPQQYKEEALTELRNIAFDPEAQGSFIERAKASPLYQQIMGGKAAGEEAVMRHSSMTGGLRSGNVQEGLYDYNVGLEREALTSVYDQQMGGLQQLAGIPTNEQQIGQTYSNIASTQAAGKLGAAQARQAGTANLFNLGLGVGGLALGYAGI